MFSLVPMPHQVEAVRHSLKAGPRSSARRLSPHDLSRPTAIGGRKDDFGAPDMLLRSAAIGDDRLKPTAIFRRDVHDSSCSHNESLNCFGRFGNRPNESDHEFVGIWSDEFAPGLRPVVS